MGEASEKKRINGYQLDKNSSGAGFNSEIPSL